MRSHLAPQTSSQALFRHITAQRIENADSYAPHNHLVVLAPQEGRDVQADLLRLRRALLASRRPGQATLEERLRGSGLLRSAALIAWHRAKLLGHNRFRLLLVGGAALPRETEDFWRRSGVWLVQGYGLAETAARQSAPRLTQSRRPNGWPR